MSLAGPIDQQRGENPSPPAIRNSPHTRRVQYIERSFTVEENRVLSEDCSVCLEAIRQSAIEAGEESMTYARTLCGHHFHESCLDRALIAKLECPNCRGDLFDHELFEDQIFEHLEQNRFEEAAEMIEGQNHIPDELLDRILTYSAEKGTFSTLIEEFPEDFLTEKNIERAILISTRSGYLLEATFLIDFLLDEEICNQGVPTFMEILMNEGFYDLVAQILPDFIPDQEGLIEFAQTLSADLRDELLMSFSCHKKWREAIQIFKAHPEGLNLSIEAIDYMINELLLDKRWRVIKALLENEADKVTEISLFNILVKSMINEQTEIVELALKQPLNYESTRNAFNFALNQGLYDMTALFINPTIMRSDEDRLSFLTYASEALARQFQIA